MKLTSGWTQQSQARNAMFRSLIVAASLCLATFAHLAHAEQIRRDGNWWRDLTPDSRIYYILGVLDGKVLGHNFSTWPLMDSKDAKKRSAADHAGTAYALYSHKYFSGVTVGQTIDGLNAFYEDYRNRSIEIPGAIWLVVNGIAGTPEKELNGMIESWRKNAK